MEEHIIINVLRILNVIVAIAALPPSFSLLRVLNKERKKLSKKRYDINSMLADTFLIFIAILVLNALISFLLFINFDLDEIFGKTIGQSIFNIRNLGINVALFFISWGLYFTTKAKGGDN